MPFVNDVNAYNLILTFGCPSGGSIDQQSSISSEMFEQLKKMENPKDNNRITFPMTDFANY